MSTVDHYGYRWVILQIIQLLLRECISCKLNKILSTEWILSCVCSDTGAICPATRSRKSSTCSSVTRRQPRLLHTRRRRRQLPVCTAAVQPVRAAVKEQTWAGRAPRRPAARSARCSRVTAEYYVITPCPTAATAMTSPAAVRRKWRHRSTPCCLAAERHVRTCCRLRRTLARRIFRRWLEPSSCLCYCYNGTNHLPLSHTHRSPVDLPAIAAFVAGESWIPDVASGWFHSTTLFYQLQLTAQAATKVKSMRVRSAVWDVTQTLQFSCVLRHLHSPLSFLKNEMMGIEMNKWNRPWIERNGCMFTGQQTVEKHGNLQGHQSEFKTIVKWKNLKIY